MEECMEAVRRNKEGRRERFLTADEFHRFSTELKEAKADNSVIPSAVADIWLRVLIWYCRNDIDRMTGKLKRRSSNTGAQWVPLTPVVEAALAGIGRLEGKKWVIASTKPEGYRLRHYTQKFAAPGGPFSWLRRLRSSAAPRGAGLS